MDSSAVQQVIEDFDRVTALIIGDVMIDSYYWGKVDRISPEAPVPVVSVTKRDNRLGGAANVALNVKALGGTPILCSVIGTGEKGRLFEELMGRDNLDTSGILNSENRTTTVKTRIISAQQQMLRVDEEVIEDLESELRNEFVDRLKSILEEKKVDVIIFEDYDKGIITPELITAIVDFAREKGIPVTVDPKKKNFGAYRNVTLFKPNLKELKEGLKIDLDKRDLNSLGAASNQLSELLNPDMMMVTLSEEGVFIQRGEENAIFPAHLRSIADVSGAGDTVISVASLCLALQCPPEVIAQLSNLAGGLVCELVGVVPIDKDRFRKEATALFA